MKISIIVPCYKVEDFLPKCVESLMAQSHKDIEIILVDDGSPDDTGKLCDEYAKKDSRIKVVHKQNGGLVSARNAGYDVATGDWIMYVDGDDWLDADCCQIMLDAIADNLDVDIVFWKCIQELGEHSIKGNGSGLVKRHRNSIVVMNVKNWHATPWCISLELQQLIAR